MIRSYDPELLRKKTKDYRDFFPDWLIEPWVNDRRNVVYLEGDNIGLATFEYPGVYTVHWFFTVRGREAIRLAKKMADRLFQETDAKGIRGMTRSDLKAARWALRQVGMKSLGTVTTDKGEYELSYMTKEQFMEQRDG